MSNLRLITEAAALENHISNTIAKGIAYREDLHLGAVSVLAFTALHGNTSNLQRFFNGLVKNDQTAFKNYVTKFQTVLNEDGEPIRDAFGKLVSSDVTFLTMEKAEFKIIGGAMANRERFAAFAKDVLLPENKGWKPFYQSDNVADNVTLGDQNILKVLAGLLKKATGQDAKVNSAVSPKMVELLRSTVDMASSIKAQPDKKVEAKVEKPSTEPTQPVAKPTKAPKATKVQTLSDIGAGVAGRLAAAVGATPPAV